jgi:hypothetical protein
MLSKALSSNDNLLNPRYYAPALSCCGLSRFIGICLKILLRKHSNSSILIEPLWFVPIHRDLFDEFCIELAKKKLLRLTSCGLSRYIGICLKIFLRKQSNSSILLELLWFVPINRDLFENIP